MEPSLVFTMAPPTTTIRYGNLRDAVGWLYRVSWSLSAGCDGRPFCWNNNDCAKVRFWHFYYLIVFLLLFQNVFFLPIWKATGWKSRLGQKQLDSLIRCLFVIVFFFALQWKATNCRAGDNVLFVWAMWLFLCQSTKQVYCFKPLKKTSAFPEILYHNWDAFFQFWGRRLLPLFLHCSHVLM